MEPNQNPHQPGNVFTPNQPVVMAPPEQTEPAAVAAEPAPAQPWQPPVAAAPVAFNDVTAPSQPVQPAAVVAAPADSQVDVPPSSPTAAAADENPEKSYVLALALSYFFGTFGIDRFYLGKKGTGFAKLFTLGGLGIWHLIDLILLAFGRLRAKNDDRPLEGFAKNYPWVKLLAIILIIFDVLVIAAYVIIVSLAVTAGLQQKAQQQQYKQPTTTTMTMTSGTPGQGM